MRGVKEFLKDSRPAMIDYILVVSTPAKDRPHSETDVDLHDRLNIITSLRERGTKPTLDHESIPVLPHLLDIPRQLAIITSAVIRNSRDYLSKQNSSEPSDRQLYEFCSRCFEVEEQALQRVSRLATRITPSHRVTASSSSMQPRSPVSAQPPSSPLSVSSSGRGSSRNSRRPSTAPSPSDDRNRRRMLFDSSSPPRTFDRAGPSDSVPPSPVRVSSQTRLLHIKSPSTDSVPSLDSRRKLAPSSRTEAPMDLDDSKRKKRLQMLRSIWKR